MGCLGFVMDRVAYRVGAIYAQIVGGRLLGARWALLGFFPADQTRFLRG